MRCSTACPPTHSTATADDVIDPYARRLPYPCRYALILFVFDQRRYVIAIDVPGVHTGMREQHFDGQRSQL